MERLLADLSINVTAMFRDPGFHRALRSDVLPGAAHAPVRPRLGARAARPGRRSCSVAIALREEGMLERTRIYATDMDADVLAARAPRVVRAGARCATTRATTSRPAGPRPSAPTTPSRATSATFDPALLQPVVFAQHNLATDHSFNEFHVVICRNVLIYFGARPAGPRAAAVRREPAAPRRARARAARRRCAAPRSRIATKPLVEAERIYRRS